MNKQLILKALRCHDGHTLMPEWTWEKQIELSVALDELRAKLRAVNTKTATCPHCGANVKGTGSEQFGRWACGKSIKAAKEKK